MVSRWSISIRWMQSASMEFTRLSWLLRSCELKFLERGEVTGYSSRGTIPKWWRTAGVRLWKALFCFTGLRVTLISSYGEWTAAKPGLSCRASIREAGRRWQFQSRSYREYRPRLAGLPALGVRIV